MPRRTSRGDHGSGCGHGRTAFSTAWRCFVVTDSGHLLDCRDPGAIVGLRNLCATSPVRTAIEQVRSIATEWKPIHFPSKT